MNNAQELKAHLQDSNKARMYEEKKKQDKLKQIPAICDEQKLYDNNYITQGQLNKLTKGKDEQ